MSDNGRLIINRRGETAQVLNLGPGRGDLTLQVMVLYDQSVGETEVTNELDLSRDGARALILKLANAIGDVCELTPRGRRPMSLGEGLARHNDRVIRALKGNAASIAGYKRDEKFPPCEWCQAHADEPCRRDAAVVATCQRGLPSNTPPMPKAWS